MDDLLNTKQVAAALGIGREAARLLMAKTRGVVTLPAVCGTGKRVSRRMPRAVLETLLVQCSRKTYHQRNA